jgi:single-strand DNA-binding protein
MSRSINKVILVGRTGRDPDITKVAGVTTAHVSLATTSQVSAGDRYEGHTMWHRLKLTGRLANVAEDYLRKGDRIYVEGSIEYDSFERNGVTIPTAEVHVKQMVLLGAGGVHVEEEEEEGPDTDALRRELADARAVIHGLRAHVARVAEQLALVGADS